jgi:GT2 family glycosyltransferase
MCLASLRETTHPNTRPVLVDNGTTDRSGEALAAEFPEALFIRSEQNLGFCGGNNLGARAALDDGADHVLFLNNDTEIAPDAIAHMVETMERNPAIGALNPKILYADPPDMIWYAGGTHSLWLGRNQHTGWGEIDRGQFDQPREVTFISGCAFHMRREVIERVGLFDERLFIYAEDLDLGVRIRRAGWKLWCEPRALVVHHEKVRRRKTVPDPWRLRLCTRNLHQVAWRHGHPLQRLTAIAWLSLRWTAYLTAKNLALGFPGDVKAIWAGIGDAVRGRTGPPPATN